MAEVWPYAPMPRISEKLSWLTAVHARRDDDSRFPLRSARQSFMLSFNLALEDYQTARFLFAANAAGEWLVPVWTEATTGLAIGISDTELAVDMNAEFVPGGWAIVWASPTSWTAVQIDTRETASITLTAAVGAAYARAAVMPLRTCICREGLTLTRQGQELYQIDAEFEALDNPDLVDLIEPLQVTLAQDVSASMSTVVADGLTRLDIAKQNLLALLYYLEETGLPHDVHIVGWSFTAVEITRLAAAGADWQDLRDFVSAMVVASGTDFAQAFTGASSFYYGPRRRIMIFATDGEPTYSPAAAVALRDAISDLEVYGFNIDLSVTTSTDQVDNTGGAVVVHSEGLTLFEAIIIGLLGLPAQLGLIYLAAAGGFLGAQAGKLMRAAVFVDSGLGTVAIEPVRTIIEDSIAATLRPCDAAARFQLKQVLHFLGGQDRPFLMPDFALPILASTTTSVTVAPVRAAAADWVGDVILAGGHSRAVTAGADASGNHQLSFAAISPKPTGTIWRLRRVRQSSDEVQIDHIRGQWASLGLSMVAA